MNDLSGAKLRNYLQREIASARNYAKMYLDDSSQSDNALHQLSLVVKFQAMAVAYEALLAALQRDEISFREPE